MLLSLKSPSPSLSLWLDTCHETFYIIIINAFIFFLFSDGLLLFLISLVAKKRRNKSATIFQLTAKISNCYAIVPRFLSFLPFIEWNFHYLTLPSLLSSVLILIHSSLFLFLFPSLLYYTWLLGLFRHGPLNRYRLFFLRSAFERRHSTVQNSQIALYI